MLPYVTLTQYPRKNISNRRENASRCHEDTEIASSNRFGRCQDNIAHTTDNSQNYEHKTALLSSICNVRRDESNEKGKEEGRGRQTLSSYIRKSHF